ncbi:MAG TPA: undecaprenyldiphospho-muramoylpentapeptide beta-N-acetylglucosaminyltransferase [Thermomicrobiales bacterium]
MASARPLRLVIAGGGTGGHVNPALAVVEELRSREIPLELLWIGSHGDVEGPAANRAGIPFRAIQTGKLRRYVSLKTIPDSIRFPIGIAQAWRILRQFRPDVIFSTGGFVSVPTVLAGSRMAPILTHEQTAILGLATRINLRAADVLAVTFPDSVRLARGFSGRTEVTGNPVRPSLLAGDAGRGFSRFGFDPGLPLVYVTGGARGASPINQRVAAILPELLKQCQVLHQTGPTSANDDARRMRELRTSLPDSLQSRYHIVEMVRDELADVYAAASLVLGRAGAGTVAELALLGKPAVLIPLPGSGGGEQQANAAALASAGGAIVISQEDASPERLLREITALVTDQERLATMSAGARTLARPDATRRLADLLLELAHSGQGPATGNAA